ncbi:mechanosensitive ion channel family protein [Sulfitobacter albidus]|uniref:Mechanosensitive ion channel family protein n=2 Tax=Sulfitobacter albidus TaxID=2829501 RepID=A0A975PNM8_9RHOB|nr:mechanosensitive ion channel family protein [Sulfitobacter albidus]
MIVGILFALFAAFATATGGQAQGLGSVLGEPAEGQSDSDLAAAVRAAAAAGLSVVVIDSDGRLVETGAPTVEPAAVPVAGGSNLMKVQEQADAVRDALFERLRNLPASIQEVIFILRAASPDGTLMLYAEILGYSLLLFGAGVIVERQIFGKRLMRGLVVSRIMENPQGYTEKMPFLAFRFVMGVFGILVSMAVAYLLGALIFDPITDSAAQFTITLINLAYFLSRVIAGLWRMIFSPFLTQYRIPALTDREAKRLHRWFWVVGSLGFCATLFTVWIRELGLNYDVYAFMSSLLSAIIVLLNIVGILVNRRAINTALRGGKEPAESGWPLRFVTRAWAPFAIVYLLYAWVDLTAGLVLEQGEEIPLVAGAYIILVSIIVVYGLVNYVIERGFARARLLRAIRARQAEIEAAEEAERHAEALRLQGAEQDEPEPEEDSALEADSPAGPLAARIEPARDADQTLDLGDDALLETHAHELNSFEALARRVAGILAFVAGAYAFFYIWDTEGARMVESTTGRFLDILVIIFLGYIVYHVFRIWIDNKIAEEVGDEEEGELGDEGGGSSATRLATLLPLFRNVVLIVVVVSIGLIALMEMGINVGPLFAGAGIVGIAIGFGSQALVQDIFAGAFFLFDDAFRKGEYLDVGGVKGTVEKISVRSMQLRHHLGALHTIPFGQLQVMTNYSRDWVMMKLPLRVTYDTDVEKVRKLIKKLGQRLLDDPVIGDDFIQPLKSQGVIEMQDSAMIIRVKFMTKPGDQWIARKRVYEEIRTLFEENDIKFAHREVTVRLADGKVSDLTPEQRREVAAAAHASLQEDDMAPGWGDDSADDR